MGSTKRLVHLFLGRQGLGVHFAMIVLKTLPFAFFCSATVQVELERQHLVYFLC